MTICKIKLANALKYQDKTLTMNDNVNKILGTNFMHWALVRKVKATYKRPVTSSEVFEWLSNNK